MDPRRSPERVGKADVTDQFADVRRQLRTAARRSRLPSPVKAKTRAVPADYSFWLNNRQGAQHVRCQTIQSGEYQPIELAECRPLRRFTSQDVQLMAQHQDLCLQRDPRLEKPDQRTPDQSAELDHQADDSPDSPPPANRIRFPTGTTTNMFAFEFPTGTRVLMCPRQQLQRWPRHGCFSLSGRRALKALDQITDWLILLRHFS